LHGSDVEFEVKFSGSLLQSATYGHVGTYKFKKVLRVRIVLAPPRSLGCREIRRYSSKIARNGRNSPDFALKLDWRKCSGLSRRRDVWLFSLKGTLAVRFQRPHQANVMRSQTDEAAKAGLDLVELQKQVGIVREDCTRTSRPLGISGLTDGTVNTIRSLGCRSRCHRRSSRRAMQPSISVVVANKSISSASGESLPSLDTVLRSAESIPSNAFNSLRYMRRLLRSDSVSCG
jgi:hypothetical protein